MIYCGASPHFCDIDEQTLGLDHNKLANYLSEISASDQGGLINKKTGARLTAVVPMHTFGSPVEMEGLLEVAGGYSMPVVEDAAEALGSFYRGRHCGTLGQLGILSFNGNKIVTTGGGGTILTSDEKLANEARHLSTTAKIPHRWEMAHDQVGFNYRMPNINAALGLAQLERLAGFLEAKKRLAARYVDAFKNLEGVNIFTPPACSDSNYWLNTALLDTPDPVLLGELIEAAASSGYMARPAWTPLHQLPMYRDCPSMELAVTENIANKAINLPSSVSL